MYRSKKNIDLRKRLQKNNTDLDKKIMYGSRKKCMDLRKKIIDLLNKTLKMRWMFVGRRVVATMTTKEDDVCW